MPDSDPPRIAFAEWLAPGVVVLFADGHSVYYPAHFLHQHRNAPGTRIFLPDGSSPAPFDGKADGHTDGNDGHDHNDGPSSRSPRPR